MHIRLLIRPYRPVIKSVLRIHRHMTALTCLILRQTGTYDKRKFYLFLFLCTTGGALTHYYCIVFAVFISVVYGCVLLCRKEWKKAGAFWTSMTPSTHKQDRKRRKKQINENTPKQVEESRSLLPCAGDGCSGISCCFSGYDRSYVQQWERT